MLSDKEQKKWAVRRLRSDSWLWRNVVASSEDESITGCMAWILWATSWLIVLITLPFSLFFCVKVIREYERAVVMRLGRLTAGGARGPGLVFLLPCIDTYQKIDLRVISFDVPPQEILSSDSVTVTVEAVVCFHIFSPVISVTNVNDAFHSTKLLAQTTLRNILGMKTLSEMLAERNQIADLIEQVLDEGTEPWGVKVDRVEVKDIHLPPGLTRVMAAEAEADRKAKAKFIAAEGEKQCSQFLIRAASILDQNSVALQLRYLQTLAKISAEKNSTIVVPIPMELLQYFSAE
ncbi:unnamed protein product [Soboliphyme baturini]|uniref:PHB domain-containing protein n=1 Tax=Soboliphyme baturini TaxID=241478 RepID=A0A183IX23_9BILA|nr:unnamed protein product [Soboliphyme baturini]